MFSRREQTKTLNKLSLAKDGTYATTDVLIVFPKKFIKLKLASIKENLITLGVIGIVSDGNFASLTIPTELQLEEPMSIETVQYNEMDYIVLEYTKGSKLFGYDSIVNGDHLFTIFDSLILRNNNIPAYLSYEDILRIFTNGVDYANSKISTSPVEMALLLSVIAKADEGFARQKFSRKQLLSEEINYKGLADVTALDDVFSLIAGNYQSKGITRALALGDKAKRTNIEQYLRV